MTVPGVARCAAGAAGVVAIVGTIPGVAVAGVSGGVRATWEVVPA